MEAHREEAPTDIYRRLSSLNLNESDPRGANEPVVVAFGGGDRFYVCWKDSDGSFKQDYRGQPDSLQAWLFPQDGTSRDFPTLQLMFGHGEEFYASDKNGSVSHTDPESRPKPRDDFSRPTSIFLPDRPPLHQDSFGISTSQQPRAEKSHIVTIDTEGVHSTRMRRRRTISLREPSSASSARSHSTSFSRDSVSNSRGSSSDSRDSTYSQYSALSSPTTVASHCSCGSTERRSYADASVQTVKSITNLRPQQEVTLTSAPYSASANYIGRLQDYFRSDDYRLGNFFGAGQLA